MRLLATAFAMLIILVIQAPLLAVHKKWRELAVFLLLWSTAAAYALLFAADVDIPAPSQIITDLMVSAKKLVINLR